MKWSAPLVTSSIGTRAADVHVTPSAERLNTMSLDEQRRRNRQSSQATNVVPSAAISALGSGLVRRPPATPWKRIASIVTALVHDWPPSVERNDWIFPFSASKGTITVPFGWTTGCPPRPLSWPAVSIGTLHVRPPSVEVLISSRSPSPKLSSSV
jgi:hypothetical protein